MDTYTVRVHFQYEYVGYMLRNARVPSPDTVVPPRQPRRVITAGAPRMGYAAVLGALAAACEAAWLVPFAICHLVTTGFSPVQNAVSDYGATKASYPFAMAQWWMDAIAAFLLVGALSFVLVPADASNAGIITLGIFGCARIGTSLFPVIVRHNRPPDQPPILPAADGTFTQEQINLRRRRIISTVIHVVFAVLSFACITIASITVSATFQNAAYAGTVLGNNAKLLLFMGYAVLGGLCCMVASRWMGRIDPTVAVFGLGERIFYLTKFVWLLTFAIVMTMT